MSDTLSARTLAEHLSTLACLLEAEAARAHALGLQPGRDLVREAREVRALCDLLWEADIDFRVAGTANAGRVAPASGNVVPIGAART